MISEKSIITRENRILDLLSYYYGSSDLISRSNNSLYGFLSYKNPWNETIVTGKVTQTKIIKTIEAIAGSNTITLYDTESLADFFVGMRISSNTFSYDTYVSDLNEENISMTLTTQSSNNFFGNCMFIGLNDDIEAGSGDLISINPLNSSVPLSNTKDFYANTSIYIDVENVAGGLTYTRTIKSYDAVTKTVRLDSHLNDSPLLTTSSSIKIYYDNTHPPAPEDNAKYIKQVHKDMYYMKKLDSTSICPVIQRVNWTYGLIYDYYKDTVNMVEKGPDGKLLKTFYVMNQFYQVFKCLWNNNGAISTTEPVFVAGNYDDVTKIVYSPLDGYKWKYLYTVSLDEVQIFLDDNYIPVNIDRIAVQESIEGYGGIEVVNVITGGSNYNPTTNPITINITGDGTGATARADVVSNSIVDIIVTNTGKNYTYANVSVTSTLGSGCTAKAIPSPVAGHGSNLLSELGCEKLMVTCKFSQDEDTTVPTDMQIRQFGLISNPVSSDPSTPHAEKSNYMAGYLAIVSPGTQNFTRGEKVFQSTNNANYSGAYFSATCVDFDIISNRLILSDILGTYKINGPLYGKDSGTYRTMINFIEPEIVKYSGDIIYIQNTEEIQRSSDSIELFRILLKF